MTPLQVAIGELGTTEYPRNSNRVKYNDWFYGVPVQGDSYPWCMAFVQWCFSQAGHMLPYKTASCSALLNWYKANKPSCVITKNPLPNDIVIYTFGHTGIVERFDNTTVTCIEGNTSATSASNGGEVLRATRSLNQVWAFIRVADFSTKKSEEKEDNMTGEEIYKKLGEYLAEQPVPDWAKQELEEAKRLGITDGSAPMALIPRYQAAIMAKRALQKR